MYLTGDGALTPLHSILCNFIIDMKCRFFLFKANFPYRDDNDMVDDASDTSTVILNESSQEEEDCATQNDSYLEKSTVLSISSIGEQVSVLNTLFTPIGYLIARSNSVSEI